MDAAEEDANCHAEEAMKLPWPDVSERSAAEMMTDHHDHMAQAVLDHTENAPEPVDVLSDPNE